MYDARSFVADVYTKSAALTATQAERRATRKRAVADAAAAATQGYAQAQIADTLARVRARSAVRV